MTTLILDNTVLRFGEPVITRPILVSNDEYVGICLFLLQNMLQLR